MKRTTNTRQCTLWYMLATVGCCTVTKDVVAKEAVNTMSRATKEVMEVCCSLKMYRRNKLSSSSFSNRKRFTSRENATYKNGDFSFCILALLEPRIVRDSVCFPVKFSSVDIIVASLRYFI